VPRAPTSSGLSQGEPDFDTPEHNHRSGSSGNARWADALHTGGCTPELKQAIVAKFRRENGLGYQRRTFRSGRAVSQILYNALMATLDPGDEVVIPAPSWVAYAIMTEFAEGVAGLGDHTIRE